MKLVTQSQNVTGFIPIIIIILTSQEQDIRRFYIGYIYDNSHMKTFFKKQDNYTGFTRPRSKIFIVPFPLHPFLYVLCPDPHTSSIISCIGGGILMVLQTS